MNTQHQEVKRIAATERLAKARAEMTARLGGEEAVQRLHELALQSMYSEHAEGRSLD